MGGGDLRLARLWTYLAHGMSGAGGIAAGIDGSPSESLAAYSRRDRPGKWLPFYVLLSQRNVDQLENSLASGTSSCCRFHHRSLLSETTWCYRALVDTPDRKNSAHPGMVCVHGFAFHWDNIKVKCALFFRVEGFLLESISADQIKAE